MQWTCLVLYSLRACYWVGLASARGGWLPATTGYRGVGPVCLSLLPMLCVCVCRPLVSQSRSRSRKALWVVPRAVGAGPYPRAHLLNLRHLVSTASPSTYIYCTLLYVWVFTCTCACEDVEYGQGQNVHCVPQYHTCM